MTPEQEKAKRQADDDHARRHEKRLAAMGTVTGRMANTKPPEEISRADAKAIGRVAGLTYGSGKTTIGLASARAATQIDEWGKVSRQVWNELTGYKRTRKQRRLAAQQARKDKRK